MTKNDNNDVFVELIPLLYKILIKVKKYENENVNQFLKTTISDAMSLIEHDNINDIYAATSIIEAFIGITPDNNTTDISIALNKIDTQISHSL